MNNGVTAWINEQKCGVSDIVPVADLYDGYNCNRDGIMKRAGNGVEEGGIVIFVSTATNIGSLI